MVIVDTDVIIAAIRGNEIALGILLKYKSKGLYISQVTEMELFAGATNTAKRNAVNEVLRNHEVLPLSKAIGDKAVHLLKTYNNKRGVLMMADALIAATCIHHDSSLITFNTKDFKMIKGLQLAK
jgi:predicted nucleic acid-binding protein